MRVQNNHRYSARIIIRSDAPRKDGRASLSLQVFINGKRRVTSLGIHTRPENFNRRQQRVEGTENADLMNAVIHKTMSRVEKIFYQAILDDRPLSPDRFMDLFMSKASRSDFLEFIDREIQSSQIVKAEGTIKNYRKLYNRLRKFRDVILMSDIDYAFVEEFDRYLRRRKYEGNTIWGYHKNLKSFINLARKRGVRMQQPYDQFKFSKAKTSRTYLTPEEVKILVDMYQKELLSVSKQRVLRYFLFQCFTSLRIQDVRVLTQDNILNDTLVFRPEKTKRSRVILKIPITEFAQKLVCDSLKEHSGETIFQCLSNQKSNEALKEIAETTSIRKNLTTHVGRHTFATLFLSLGGNVEVLKDIMGHSDIRTTMVYVHITQKQKVKMVGNIDRYFTGHLV